jgi:hypothetical protein
MKELTDMILLVMVFTWPAYVLPLILGLTTRFYFKKDELSRMAGWFSLKPILATPLWALMISIGNSTHLSRDLQAALGLIPGIGLTLWIVWKYRHLLRTETGTVTLLLLGDALRWLNSFAWVIDNALDSPFYTAGLILPNAYALMAFVIAWLRKRRSLQAAQVGM